MALEAVFPTLDREGLFLSLRGTFVRNWPAQKLFSRLDRRFSESKNGFCCLPLLNRGPKEDGDRKAKPLARAARQVVRCGAGFLPSPLLCGGSGNGKIVHQNSSGEPTQ
jgi:hypothetical protein